MDKSVIEVARKFRDKIKDIIPYKMLVVYGSYAKGTAHKDSDIDLAVICDKLDEKYLTHSAKMYEFVRDIDLRLEPILLGMENDQSGFVKNIIKTGYVIDS